MTYPAVKPHHPLAELLARKLFAIENVPKQEQRRMVQRAIKAAVEWHESHRAPLGEKP